MGILLTALVVLHWFDSYLLSTCCMCDNPCWAGGSEVNQILWSKLRIECNSRDLPGLPVIDVFGYGPRWSTFYQTVSVAWRACRSRAGSRTSVPPPSSPLLASLGPELLFKTLSLEKKSSSKQCFMRGVVEDSARAGEKLMEGGGQVTENVSVLSFLLWNWGGF